jgi:hypothetical protein
MPGPLPSSQPTPAVEPVVTPDPSNAGAIVATTPPVSPPNPTGLTPSAPINMGMGATVVGGSNAGTTAIAGADVALLAGGLTMGFQFLKGNRHFDQHRWAHLTLLLLGILIGVVVLGILGHQAWDTAIAKGAGIATQAYLNYTGAKVAGLPGLPAAASGGGFVNT